MDHIQDLLVGLNVQTMMCNYSIIYVMIQGWVQKFQKGGAGSQTLERGGQNLTFQCSFQSFSYKSPTNIPAKGGAAARLAPPLNPHL